MLHSLNLAISATSNSFLLTNYLPHFITFRDLQYLSDYLFTFHITSVYLRRLTIYQPALSTMVIKPRYLLRLLIYDTRFVYLLSYYVDQFTLSVKSPFSLLSIVCLPYLLLFSLIYFDVYLSILSTCNLSLDI